MVLSRSIVKNALNSAILRLKRAKIDSAALDAEVLLAFALKEPKEYLYTHPEEKISSGQLRLFQKLIARRAKHEPVAYLTGIKEFFGLNFIVNHNVLIPRPETELMVEEALRIIKENPSSPPLTKGRRLQNPSPDSRRVLPLIKGEENPPPFDKGGTRGILIDIGTGSGCIPIVIVKNSGINAIAIDTSAAALKIAKQNAKRHNILDSRLRGNDKKESGNDRGEVRFMKSDLLKSYKLKAKSYRLIIITANLPYLPTAEWWSVPKTVKNYEPRLALDGGPDGLKYYRKLLPQIKSMAQTAQIPIFCLFEFCPEQKNALRKLILKNFPGAEIQIKKDLAGRDRVLISNFQYPISNKLQMSKSKIGN